MPFLLFMGVNKQVRCFCSRTVWISPVCHAVAHPLQDAVLCARTFLSAVCRTWSAPRLCPFGDVLKIVCRPAGFMNAVSFLSLCPYANIFGLLFIPRSSVFVNCFHVP